MPVISDILLHALKGKCTIFVFTIERCHSSHLPEEGELRVLTEKLSVQILSAEHVPALQIVANILVMAMISLQQAQERFELKVMFRFESANSPHFLE